MVSAETTWLLAIGTRNQHFHTRNEFQTHPKKLDTTTEKTAAYTPLKQVRCTLGWAAIHVSGN
jgi:hypothetical protein